MAIVGGDIREAHWDHPTLGSGTIYGLSNQTNTFSLGGLRSDDNKEGVDGGGNMVVRLTRNRWEVEFVPSWDMSTTSLEQLSALHGAPADASWTFTHENGTVYTGTGRPVGDLVGDGGTPSISLKIAGGGTLEKVT